MTSYRTRQSDWCNFAVALQSFSIITLDGTVIRKIDVFNRLYTPDSTTQLDLVVANHHPEFSLKARDDYDKSQAAMAEHDAALRTVFYGMARHEMEKHGSVTPVTAMRMMTECMKAVYDNPQQIEDAVSKILQAK